MSEIAGGVGQPSEARKGGVWDEENRLRDIINQIAERVESLASRLTPILRASIPTPETGKAKAEEAVPDLIEQLRARNRKAEQIDVTLASLLERLEI